MAMQRWILAALLACGACKGKGKAEPGTAGSGDVRCDELAKTCSDNEKHVDKLAEGCKQASVPGCAAKLNALFDCYEKSLCGKGDRIWAFEDLAVLADRKNLCADERKAASACK